MKFNKNVPLEHQEILIKLLKEYEHNFTNMTREERHLLHMWVRNGNSPYDNGDYVCDDNCRPMDFVNTLRFWEDMKECLDALSENDVLSEKSTNSFDDVPDSYKEGFIIPEELRQKVEVEVLI